MGIIETFNPTLIMLSLALVDGGFKYFHTIDEIFSFKPSFNGDAWILEWADPLRALPTAFINLLSVLKQLVSSISSPILPLQWPSQRIIQRDPIFGAKLMGYMDKVTFSSHYIKYAEIFKRFSGKRICP